MNDVVAWSKYPKYNWLYIKTNLCDLQNIKWVPCPVIPDEFPVIVRPIINLTGMGAEVKIAKNLNEYEKCKCYGFFATKFIDGIHTSHDLEIINGIPQKETIMKGYKLKNYPGGFLYWELLSFNQKPNLTTNIKILLDKLSDFSGDLNIECIDETIIEVHLRKGDVDIITKYYSQPGILFFVPIWNFSNLIDLDLNLQELAKQEGVLDILIDNENITITGNKLRRRATVITTVLPKSFHNNYLDLQN